MFLNVASFEVYVCVRVCMACSGGTYRRGRVWVADITQLNVVSQPVKPLTQLGGLLDL